jgi:hypothetical protein
METKKQYKESMKQKIDKHLVKLTKRKRKMTQINRIRDEKGNITTDNRKSRESLGNILKLTF